MKNVARVLVSIFALSICPVAALANQVIQDSNSSTVSYIGFNSTPTFYAAPSDVSGSSGWSSANGWNTPSTSQGGVAAGAAVNLTVNSTNGSENYWAAPIGTSTWVSYLADTQPSTNPWGVNGGVGVYEYMSNAFTTTTGEVVQLSVLADNTTAVYLVNGNGQTYQIASYPSGYPATIDGGTPDYSTVDNIILLSSELTATGNKLYFDVSNTANSGSNPSGSPTGLDYELDSLSPEPSSFLLLATGMLGAAGVVRRRVRA